MWENKRIDMLWVKVAQCQVMCLERLFLSIYRTHFYYELYTLSWAPGSTPELLLDRHVHVTSRGNPRCPAQTVSLKDQPSHLQVFWLDNLIPFLMTAGQSGNRDRMIDVWGQFFWFWCLNVKWLVLCIFDSRFGLTINFSRLEIIVLIQKNVFIKLMKL